MTAAKKGRTFRPVGEAMAKITDQELLRVYQSATGDDEIGDSDRRASILEDMRQIVAADSSTAACEAVSHWGPSSSSVACFVAEIREAAGARNQVCLESLIDGVRKETAVQDKKFPWPRPFGPQAQDADLRALVVALEPYARSSHWKTGEACWLAILLEEVCEAAREDLPRKLVEELVQVAAVALSWAQAVREEMG